MVLGVVLPSCAVNKIRTSFHPLAMLDSSVHTFKTLYAPHVHVDNMKLFDNYLQRYIEHIKVITISMKHYSAKALARCNHGSCLSTLELATG